ncbi:MAG: phosphate ABC transporter substrate-binding protein PstS [Chloroflexi bacterium]|nr:phosphate ABC transporter substrate-binding protein PstS [Chloroflexota bacterium]
MGKLPTGTFLLVSCALLAFLMVSAAPACSGGQKPTTTTTSPATTGRGRITLQGAGATFPYPLYSKMFSEYGKISNVDINYQSIGSGGGIQQITNRTVDFGASDGILTDAQLAAAPASAPGSNPLLHIPMTSGAEAIIFNLPGASLPAGTTLRLAPDVLADIFLLKIKKWNDPRIAALNTGATLPATDIAVVHRSDGSGTTYIFTNYLSKVSQEWKDRVGNATAVRWPGGIGGQGNEGVAGQVSQIPGAIGYVELAYALQNKLAHAALKNRAGNFVLPSVESSIAAATGVALPDDMKVMITDSANPGAYPIAGFTWILVYKQQADLVKGQALMNMLWWAIHDGQKYGPPLYYAPLSADAVKKAEAIVRSVTYNGQPLVK